MNWDALARCRSAQADIYPRALGELRDGRKTSHWMWFVFPQIAGLGTSAMARLYAIRDLDEARAYLSDAILGARLIETAETMLGWAGRRSAETILGGIDAAKLKSSMTLFEATSDDDNMPFAACLDAFYDGERDAATLGILAGQV